MRRCARTVVQKKLRDFLREDPACPRRLPPSRRRVRPGVARLRGAKTWIVRTEARQGRTRDPRARYVVPAFQRAVGVGGQTRGDVDDFLYFVHVAARTGAQDHIRRRRAALL